MTPELLIDDLILRPLSLQDAPAVHRLINDWSVVRMLSRLPFPYPRDLADQWIASVIADSQSGTAYHFAVTRAGTLLGVVGVTITKPQHSATLGYWIGPTLWGQGITTRATQRVTEWAFTVLKLKRMTADVSVDNPASAAVLRKNGFQEVGQSTRRFVSRGQECPITLFERTETIMPMPEAPLPADTAQSDVPASPVPPVPTPPPPAKTRTLLVVAAALINQDEQILLARRPEGKPLAGLWEFPGGKVETDESPERALIREMEEELGIDLKGACLSPFTFVSADVGARHLLMPLYVVRRWRGQPCGKEGQELAWVDAKDLHTYPMPDPDVPLIPLLRELLG
ncbi:bifunctional GNAT family N-acetyltransferase/(deoxy)nucleoside triphosphate pyrophosphohydrolase [Neokomagataea thailandica]|uniref:8-oxo-dGTP diphosphatase n=1 Tax=Neokomagataea tanensis NBRC 106556 TaxID=1223519 RepID=A0ABQ0QGE6_9PROT|nr:MULTISPECIES: bifunctional GNAT family N-acetyltransferase/(deoxy)nucleoside triphosphate pyrophosphohydrolase [Neokomagataea]GBR43856.1 acetyltransferase [Neokomagataea tanensis NBRC 106556]